MTVMVEMLGAAVIDAEKITIAKNLDHYGMVAQNMIHCVNSTVSDDCYIVTWSQAKEHDT